VVYAGNYTLEKAAAAGFKEIVNVHVTGDQLVNVVRDDIAPHTAEAIALGLEDNEIGKQSYSPDIDLVASLAAGDSAILSALKNEDKMFGGMLENMQPYNLDRLAEWQDMPEFNQQDLSPTKQILISFATMGDYQQFQELIGQTLSEKTRSIWYPKREGETAGQYL